MRVKKLRGHKRRWKNIENWRLNACSFEENYFFEFKRDYKEILIHPWSSLQLSNSSYPQPHGKTKLMMLEGLLNVFDYWNRELNKRGKDFSLYLWLYNNRFTKSQVVCATDEFIDFYETTFEKVKGNSKAFTSPFKVLEDRLNKFEWTFCLDEDYIDNTFLGTIDEYTSNEEFNIQKRWYNERLKKKYRDITLENRDSDMKEMFSIKMGDLWVGKLK